MKDLPEVASESGHWYGVDGSPCYTIVGANGKERPTTLRDARKSNLVPSVTTIMKVAAAPGLERWKQQQILLSAMTLPQLPDENVDSYAKRVLFDSQQHGKQRAMQGTAIHGSIERCLLGKTYNTEHEAFVDATMRALEQFSHGMWSPEKSFADIMGYGGKVDLHADGIVIDFKTRQLKEGDKLVWPESAMQLGAYRHGLGMPDAICVNIVINVDKPGEVFTHIWDESEIVKGWAKFCCLLEYWKIDKGI